jgi:hypothetical protein
VSSVIPIGNYSGISLYSFSFNEKNRIPEEEQLLLLVSNINLPTPFPKFITSESTKTLNSSFPGPVTMFDIRSILGPAVKFFLLEKQQKQINVKLIKTVKVS